MALQIEGQPVKGEFLRIGTTVNSMVDQLSSFAAEVTRVAKEVGTDGGGRAESPTPRIWRDHRQRESAREQPARRRCATSPTSRRRSRRPVEEDHRRRARGEVLKLKNTINTMVDQLNSFAAEVTRVAKEVGTEGKLGGQADVEGVGSTWKDLTDNVNFMASNLTGQVLAASRSW